MGTDGEQTFALTSTGQNDGVLGNDLCQIELLPVQEIPAAQEPAEEAQTLMRHGEVTREVSKRKCLSGMFQLRYLPIATCFWNFISFVISYATAVSLGHVEPVFPYISHTAVEVPERSIFSEMVNLGALMLAANMYMKYLQVKAVVLVNTSQTTDKCLNQVSLYLGFVSALGLTIVANFQTREMRVVHHLGALLAFVVGMVYCWLQTILSIRHRRKSLITVVQIINSVLLTICLFIFIASKGVYMQRKSAGHGTKTDTLRDVYLLSTSSEWLTAIFTITYVLTYYKDFSNVRFNFPSVRIKNEQNHHSSSGQHGGVDV